MIAFVRRHASYANVVASLALFVALGGTSYAALKLPKNSVGAKQIRTGAIDSAELRTASVGTKEIRGDAVHLMDLHPEVKEYITRHQKEPGPQGPPGKDAISFWAVVGDDGLAYAGRATRVEHNAGTNAYRVYFGARIESCGATATPRGFVSPLEAPADVSIAHLGTDYVEVQTFGQDRRPAEQMFDVIVAC